MSAREEYTPPMEVLHDIYCGIFEPINPDLKRSSAQFNRAIAAHDREVREQIAQKIEVEMRRHDNAQIGFSAVGDAYAHASRIARGEGQA